MEKMVSKMFGNTYEGKTVLVTGHTGFKGSWLTIWLLKLGAKVIGVSLDPHSKPNLFNETKLTEKISHYKEDICNFNKLRTIIEERKPDYIFHLAAQPLVKDSFKNPLNTFNTNIVGTANIIESVRNLKNQCNLILITSDKCYLNKEWEWGYREIDQLGGKDPYSASKACAELLIKTMFDSFFKDQEHIRLASTRAGNVIGGGDWAIDRIIPDSIKAWEKGKKVIIRSPASTRPWQHVLEPLSGYLCLGQHLTIDKKISGESFNFGPKQTQVKTVSDLLKKFGYYWGIKEESEIFEVKIEKKFREAGLLKLNCDKAMNILNWNPILKFDQTVQMTCSWYKSFYKEANLDMLKYTQDQIDEYTKLAISKNIPWTN